MEKKCSEPKPLKLETFLAEVYPQQIKIGLFRRSYAIKFNPNSKERINTSHQIIKDLLSYYNLQNVVRIDDHNVKKFELFSTQVSDLTELRPVKSKIALKSVVFQLPANIDFNKNVIKQVSNTKRKNQIENNCYNKRILIENRIGNF